MKIVCLGDSNTWGYDPRDFFGGPYEENWPLLLERHTGWTVVNRGENGRTIPKADIRIPEDPDLLLIMLGTNDLLENADAFEVSLRMERFLRYLSFPREKLLLLAPPPMAYGEWVTEEKLIHAAAELSEQYRGMALRLGIRFVDTAPWGIPLAFDGVHFTETGHKIFAEKMEKYIREKECLLCWKQV